jgi:hypothetical protein
MSILQQLELRFWHFIIPLIRESTTTQFILPKMYPLIRHNVFVSFLIPAIFSALLGLSIGFLLGVISPIW